MEPLTPAFKKKLSAKLLEFQKKGLESYGKYLDKELAYSVKKKNRTMYINYIETEIVKNNEKLEKISAKLLK